MTIRFNTVQTSWRFGEIDDDYSQSFTSEVFKNSAKLIKNFLPLRSGALTRRPSTEIVMDFGTLSADAYYIPFRSVEDRIAIFELATPISPDVLRFRVIDPVAQTVTSVADINIITNSFDPLAGPSWVQAGQSLFIALGAENELMRIIETGDYVFDVEGLVDNSPAPDDHLDFYIELAGLWNSGDAVGPNTSLVATAAGLDPPVDQARLDDDTGALTAAIIRLGGEVRTVAITNNENGTLDVAPTKSFSNSRIEVLSRQFALTPVGFETFLPGVVGWHQNRLVLGNFRSAPPRPTRLAFSRTNDPFVFGASPDDNGPIDLDLLVRSGEKINWILSVQQALFIGYGTEVIVFPQAKLTPANSAPSNAIPIGTVPYSPPLHDNERLVFITSDSGALHSVRFSDLVQGYQGIELSRFAPHLIINSIQPHLSPATVDDPVKRIIMNHGNLAGIGNDNLSVCSILDEQDDNVPPAWTRWEIAPGQRISQIISDGRAWFMLAENIASGQRAIIKPVYDNKDIVGDFKRDCTGAGIAWDVGSNSNDPLLNQEIVAAVYNSGELVHIGKYTTDNFGNFTTAVSGDACVAALPFESTIEMFDTQVIDNQGATQLRQKKQGRYYVYVRDTRLIEINNEPGLPDVPPAPDKPLDKHTEAIELTALGWDKEHGLKIKAVGGYNATVMALSREIEV